MWLINVKTLELEHHYGTHESYLIRDHAWDDEAEPKPGTFIPAYAILSHTWGDDEVTFQEFQAQKVDTDDGLKSKTGWRKILKTCEQASEDGIGYVWVDTCCIDKSSSAELQEAINSMFSWYAESRECYALLEDFDSSVTTLLRGQSTGLKRKKSRAIRWFARGWTLQELIAPCNVKFFDQNWILVGRREELAESIAAETKIDAGILSRDLPTTGTKTQIITELLSRLSTAQRFSWASGRGTTRPEDQAYCLLGIFNVNMPLLYGEGTEAFIRLQEAILRRSSDLSIFTWDSSGMEHEHDLFAKSPKAFSLLGSVIQRQVADPSAYLYEPELTTSGLRVRLPVMMWKAASGTGLIGILNAREKKEPHRTLALRLTCIGTSSLRIREPIPDKLLVCKAGWSGNTDRLVSIDFVQVRQDTDLRSIVIKRTAEPPALSVWSPKPADTPAGYLWVRSIVTRSWVVKEGWPRDLWNLSEGLYECPRPPSIYPTPGSGSSDGISKEPSTFEGPRWEGHKYVYTGRAMQPTMLNCTAVCGLDLISVQGFEVRIAFKFTFRAMFKGLHINILQFANSAGFEYHIQSVSPSQAQVKPRPLDKSLDDHGQEDDTALSLRDVCARFLDGSIDMPRTEVVIRGTTVRLGHGPEVYDGTAFRIVEVHCVESVTTPPDVKLAERPAKDVSQQG